MNASRCLSCHVPSTTVFPQHAEKIVAQVLAGKPQVEGIGCATCHMIKFRRHDTGPPPTFKLTPGKTIYGPFANPEENLVHLGAQSDLFRGANYCTSCHFDKVKDVTKRELPGEILQGTICQDCHMEPSTGSSTSRRGSMTRAIGRHWFRGVVIPGTLLKNRNLQAEWMPRVDIEVTKSSLSSGGYDAGQSRQPPPQLPRRRSGAQAGYLTITVKDAQGKVLAGRDEAVRLALRQDSSRPDSGSLH